MTTDNTREFVFTTNLDDVSIPLLRTALQGAMSAYGIDDDKAEEAAEIVTDHIAGLNVPDKSSKLWFKMLYDGAGGTFKFYTDSAVDLSGLCKVISGSHAWKAHIEHCGDSAETNEIVVELKKVK